MEPSFLERLNSLLHAIAGGVPDYVGPAAVAVVVLWIAWRVVRRRRARRPAIPLNLAIDIETLGDQPPRDRPPTLEYYNIPVRLAAVVVAPGGLGHELPANEPLEPLLDALIPGLDQVAAADGPVVRRWPNQLSASGFAHLLFNNAKLPGTGGKGTPWSSVAGGFKHENRPVMVGLVLRAEKPNSLGQTIIAAEREWLGCLRVRW